VALRSGFVEERAQVDRRPQQLHAFAEGPSGEGVDGPYQYAAGVALNLCAHTEEFDRICYDF
jgi:hypothetical protein